MATTAGIIVLMVRMFVAVSVLVIVPVGWGMSPWMSSRVGMICSPALHGRAPDGRQDMAPHQPDT